MAITIQDTGADTLTGGVYTAKTVDTNISYAVTTGAGAGANDAKVYLADGLGNKLTVAAAADGAKTTVYAGAGNNEIIGGAVVGNAGQFLAYGAAGNDTLTGGFFGGTLSGGAGNDLITTISGNAATAAVSNTITGGTGNDTIVLNTVGANAAINTLNFAVGDGNDTVTGFNFANGSAKFNVPASQLSYSFKRTGAAAADLTVTYGTAGDKVTFMNVATGANGAITYADNFKDASGATLTPTGFGLQLVTTAAANAGAATVSAAKSYIVGGTAADFITYNTDSVMIDGGTGTDNTLVGTATETSINLTASNVKNFKNVTGAGASQYLRGDSNANIITAGSSVSNNLWGGAGNDTLVGAGNAKANTYWFGKGDGNDVVNTEGSTDVVNLYNVAASDVTFKATGTDLEIGIVGSTDTLTISGGVTAIAAGMKIVTAGNAVVTPTFGTGAINYTGSGLVTGTGPAVGNTVTNATGVATDINLYDTTKFVNVDNATSAIAGDYLRGNSNANTLTAGANGANLWGAAGNDTMSGAGFNTNTYWFGTGEGNDVISSAVAATDVINLYNVTSANATYALDATGALTIGATGSANTLTVKGAVAAGATIKTSNGAVKLQEILAGAGATGVTYASSAMSPSLIVGASTNTDNTVNVALNGQDINLYDTSRFVNVQNATVTVAGTDNYLRGTTGSNVLTAANTGTNLWGGAGADTMVGAGAGTTYWFGKGDGNDTVKTFNNADTINLYNVKASDVSYAQNASGDLVVSFAGDTTNTLTIAGYNGAYAGANLTFKDSTGAQYKATVGTGFADTLALVDAKSTVFAGAGDDTITGYTANVSYGLIDGGTGTNTVTAGANAQVNLYDTTKFANVQNATATAAGAYLRGTSTNNVLTAVAGTNLWGAGGSDTLAGANTGTNTYWFGAKDGAVSVTGTTATDTVMLYDQGLAASSIGVTASAGGANLTLTDGSSTMTITGWANGTGVNTFSLGGNVYKASQNATTGAYSLVQK